MSKANYSRRKKLLYNIFHSDLSGSDKMIYYAMYLKYIDGEQLIEFLDTNPTLDDIRTYIDTRLKENSIRNETE